MQSLPPAVPAGSVRAYPDVAAARAALTSGEIGAYYVIPPDYLKTGAVQRVSPVIPASYPADAGSMAGILVANLVPGATGQELARVEQPLGAGLKVVDLGATQASSGTAASFLPYLVAVAIMVPLFTSGSFLFQSLSHEKESRVMEMLLVSVEPPQLLTGKLMGLAALTLVQYLIWAAILVLGTELMGVGISSLLSGIRMSGFEVLMAVLYALGGYALYASLMAGVGALTPSEEGGRGWIVLLTLPMLVPLYLWSIIVQTPNGLLAEVLSLIPFSAPMAMLLRMATAAVPVWQIGTSLGLLALTVAGVVLAMARLFRASTLLSGEPLSLRRLWAALRVPS